MSAFSRQPAAGAAPALGERCAAALTALQAASAPLTAREVGEMVGCGRHEARDLLSRLLEHDLARWSPAGWQAR